MARTFYDVVLGAKRQLTIPSDLYRQLSLNEGDHLRLAVEGHTMRMEPMVSVPRRLVSQQLMEEMQARRGVRADDLTLPEFLAKRRRRAPKKEAAVDAWQQPERLVE